MVWKKARRISKQVAGNGRQDLIASDLLTSQCDNLRHSSHLFYEQEDEDAMVESGCCFENVRGRYQ